MGIKKDRLRSLFIIEFLESGLQDSNMQPSAPKAPAMKNTTAPLINKWGLSLLVGYRIIYESQKVQRYINVLHKQAKLAQISLICDLVSYKH